MEIQFSVGRLRRRVGIHVGVGEFFLGGFISMWDDFGYVYESGYMMCSSQCSFSSSSECFSS